jgi:hypothetical protein
VGSASVFSGSGLVVLTKGCLMYPVSFALDQVATFASPSPCHILPPCYAHSAVFSFSHSMTSWSQAPSSSCDSSPQHFVQHIRQLDSV